MKRLPNLTGLRFVLAVLVVIFHIPQFFQNRGLPFYNDFAVFHKGSEAVFMFFSLSGFLIIRQLYVEKRANNTIKIKAFFYRRILRIFPLYYLVLIFGFLYYRFILPSFGYPTVADYDLFLGVLLSGTFFANIFCTYSPGGIIEMLWSIAIEEQFYFFIAPIFFFLPLKRIKVFLAVFTLLYFALYFSKVVPLLRNYSMFFFYFSFSGLCGIIMLSSTVQNLVLKFKYPLLFTFLIYFFTSIFRSNLLDIPYHMLSMVLFGLVISVLSQKKNILLDNVVLNYLGKISYGIYMYHAIVMQFVGFLFLKFLNKIYLSYSIYIVLENTLIILITVLLAHFSFKYYETYFLKLKKKF